MSKLAYIFGIYEQNKSVNEFGEIMIINYILITYWLFKKIFLSSVAIKGCPFFLLSISWLLQCPYLL